MALDRDTKATLDLLRDRTTIHRMQLLLREHGAHFSAAAWEELVKERIRPALEKGQIKQEDLTNVLREAEEHGGQHIFLYRTDSLERLINQSRVRSVLKSRGIEGIIDKPLFVDKPKDPTVVDVRWEGTEKSKSLIVKVVETRTYERRKQRPRSGNQIITEIEEFSVRAVNLFRLNPNGLMEMRVEAYTNISHYDDVVQRMWDVSGQILPRDSFEEESLARTELNVSKNMQQLQGEMDYCYLTGRNEKGNRFQLATGNPKSSLANDPDFISGINGVYTNKKGAFCEQILLRFKHRDGVGLPSRDLHVTLGAHAHEFAIRALSAKDDYEYILGKLLQYNR